VAWDDAGGRRLPNPRITLDWIHERHLEAACASAHARFAFETNRSAFLVALAHLAARRAAARALPLR